MGLGSGDDLNSVTAEGKKNRADPEVGPLPVVIYCTRETSMGLKALIGGNYTLPILINLAQFAIGG
jgi:hypothetical protein